MYWYHPDYLGNTEFITDLNGDPYQYFWYSPWGESLEDQHRYQSLANPPYDYYDSPYAFNAKEFDFETGNYCYGARYYNPKYSIWLSVDPLSYISPSQTPYHFVSNNPVMRIDPNGLTDFTNLWGKVIGTDGDNSNTDKVMVLSGAERRKIRQATRNGESYQPTSVNSDKYIRIPTPGEVKALDKIGEDTESTGREHGMAVGKNPESGKLNIEYTPAGTSESCEVFKAIGENHKKGYEPYYDAHGHPVGEYKPGHVGVPNPSDGPGEDLDIRGIREAELGYSVPSVIVGRRSAGGNNKPGPRVATFYTSTKSQVR